MSAFKNLSTFTRSYKRICVRRPGALKYTTVSMPLSEWEKALGYTGGHERCVTDAVRHVADNLVTGQILVGDFSLVVRRKALARLRGQVRNATANLAAENNKAWSALKCGP